uniref:Secreted protein n=1 Tax=Streptomyces sp. NBC_00049 TaxID=2903617 RepID=A0AAU2JRC0_9ACTN
MQITTEERRSAFRRGAAGIAFAAVLAAATFTATGAADAAEAEAAPSYDFSDCPAIPAGVDATRWKCEVLTATGSLTLGNRTLPELAPMTITHAEGPLPDGSNGQVWGALRGGPTAVPGGLLGTPAGSHSPRVARLSLQPEYGGRSDFYSVGDAMGLFTLRFRVVSPVLPGGCVIGGGETPVEIRLKRIGASQRVSQDPPVIKFDARDDAFAVPGATGCGPLGRLVNDRLGLPAATGNSITLSAHYTFKTYDRLPPRP